MTHCFWAISHYLYRYDADLKQNQLVTVSIGTGRRRRFSVASFIMVECLYSEKFFKIMTLALEL